VNGEQALQRRDAALFELRQEIRRYIDVFA
jgi:hypothetical protein